jgi:hypothetical protein
MIIIIMTGLRMEEWIFFSNPPARAARRHLRKDELYPYYWRKATGFKRSIQRHDVMTASHHITRYSYEQIVVMLSFRHDLDKET